LAAIGHSNGTRPSIAAELLDTRISGGLLGSIAYDRNGNPTRAPIAVFRLEFPARGRPTGSFPTPGAVLDRVITPRIALG
jgi:hypothetical protein